MTMKRDTALQDAGHNVGLSDALTARVVTAGDDKGGSSSPEQRVALQGSIASSASRVKRKNSAVDRPGSFIAPIIETEREGQDVFSAEPAAANGAQPAVVNVERKLSEDILKAHVQATSSSDTPFAGGTGSTSSFTGETPERGSKQRVNAQPGKQSGELLAAVEAEGAADAAGKRSSLSAHMSLPSWFWPFSRDYVQGATTDEIMRQIAASGHDASKLQQLCRGLLVERNDWRLKATQVRSLV